MQKLKFCYVVVVCGDGAKRVPHPPAIHHPWCSPKHRCSLGASLSTHLLCAQRACAAWVRFVAAPHPPPPSPPQNWSLSRQHRLLLSAKPAFKGSPQHRGQPPPHRLGGGGGVACHISANHSVDKMTSTRNTKGFIHLFRSSHIRRNDNQPPGSSYFIARISQHS